MKLKIVMAISMVLFTYCSHVNAQQLVYTPVNPAFGGKKSNYSYLMGTADAQNKFNTNKTTNKYTKETDSTTEVTQKIQDKLCIKLTKTVIKKIFSKKCSENCTGEITQGDYKITYNKTNDSIILNFTDTAGKVTTFSSPIYTSSIYE